MTLPYSAAPRCPVETLRRVVESAPSTWVKTLQGKITHRERATYLQHGTLEAMDRPGQACVDAFQLSMLVPRLWG